MTGCPSEFSPVPDDFELVDRGYQYVLKHRTAPVWIVHYENSAAPHLSVYRAYRSIGRVPRGRDPWTVDNRCIGSKDGVPTLEQAVALARGAIAEHVA